MASSRSRRSARFCFCALLGCVFGGRGGALEKQEVQRQEMHMLILQLEIELRAGRSLMGSRRKGRGRERGGVANR